MSFEDNLKQMQRRLALAGYTKVREPYDTSGLKMEDAVTDVEIIARKDEYNILYLEAESNWRGISTEVAKKNINSCLVITRYGDSHIILSTVKDHSTLNPKPRHIVIETGTRERRSIGSFVGSIKPGINHVETDERVQEAFDGFSVYKEAVNRFGESLAEIIGKTREAVDAAIEGNAEYEGRVQRFLGMCRDVISGEMDEGDVRDMLVQHILTYRIFAMVYDERDFHHANVVARELESLKELLGVSDRQVSYETMELIAESITGTEQRQEFLKKIYETFYEKYDPARADRDGIVYTPSEVVNFMVASTDQLLKRHFRKSLSDEGVTVLDPATGTGTFLVHIVNQISQDRLEKKYAHELHANEISILPYYIAALNIENAYKERTGRYREFENICWMDTLDSGVKDYGRLPSYFENDNVKRISRQQETEIHVIIGNPPYNAVQTSYNNANAAAKYPHIDQKIKNLYTKYSSAHNQNKAEDMYKRFLRWSSDRIGEKGMVVFVSNNAFLDAKADDGVRRALYDEFDHVYVVNLRGNARLAGEAWRREGGKVFGSQARVGIAISFLIKTGEGSSNIQYAEVDDYMSRKDKLKWLANNTISTLALEEKKPDADTIWLNQTNNDFDDLVPVLPRTQNESIFTESTTGITSAKDAWVFDFDKSNLGKKIKFYISVYNSVLVKYQTDTPNKNRLASWVDKKIKWSNTTIQNLVRMHAMTYSIGNIRESLYRPFVTKHLYYANIIIHLMSKFHTYFQNSQENRLIGFSNPSTDNDFKCIGSKKIVDFHSLSGGTIIVPTWRYEKGTKYSNVTRYALNLFQTHYKDKEISKEEIFYYIYALFNDPKYERKYKFNLQRNFPRIPLAKDFGKWSDIGRRLFDLHCNFDTAQEYNLIRVDRRVKKNSTRLKLRTEETEKETTVEMIIDDTTTLKGVPKEVLEYKIGSRNPLEWVLEFYKESKNQIKEDSSNDKAVRDRFNIYRFANHKEDLINLLQRVTTVCVETVRLRRELERMEWGPQPKLVFTPKPSNSKTKRIRELTGPASPMPIQGTLDGTKQERLL